MKLSRGCRSLRCRAGLFAMLVSAGCYSQPSGFSKRIPSSEFESVCIAAGKGDRRRLSASMNTNGRPDRRSTGASGDGGYSDRGGWDWSSRDTTTTCSRVCAGWSMPRREAMPSRPKNSCLRAPVRSGRLGLRTLTHRADRDPNAPGPPREWSNPHTAVPKRNERTCQSLDFGRAKAPSVSCPRGRALRAGLCPSRSLPLAGPW
jgi:hypothetical protein